MAARSKAGEPEVGHLSLRFGYVTNGLGEHRLTDALLLLADHGYDGVSLTLGHHHLDPFAPDLPVQLRRLEHLLERLGLAVVIETGARFLLDPRRKHEPSLVSDGRGLRLGLIHRAIEIAAELGAEAVSFFSGARPASVPDDLAWQWLVEGCAELLGAAEDKEVRLAFEAEPGMFIDRIEGWERLVTSLGRPARFGITLDLGHCLCLEKDTVEACVARVAGQLFNVHIEDMRRGVHEHLDFGDGEMNFVSALSALQEFDYGGLVCVELSRHAHVAHLTVPASIRFLRTVASAPSAAASQVEGEA